MVITERYLLLGGTEFLRNHSETLAAVLTCVVGQVQPRGAAYVGLVLEALLRRFPVEGWVLLRQSGVAAIMLKLCAANWMGSKNCEPDRVIVIYLTALSRALLGASNALDGYFPEDASSNDNIMPTFCPGDLVSIGYFRGTLD